MNHKTQFIFEIEPDYELSTQPLININQSDEDKNLKVRLDKWLWAARFFKTRALARSAIENGKVLYEGQKTIPSKEITVGATVALNQGKTKKIIVIRHLSTRRRSTDEANALFEEIATQSFAPSNIAMETDKKPRKIARFLRRTFALDETPKEN